MTTLPVVVVHGLGGMSPPTRRLRAESTRREGPQACVQSTAAGCWLLGSGGGPTSKHSHSAGVMLQVTDLGEHSLVQNGIPRRGGWGARRGRCWRRRAGPAVSGPGSVLGEWSRRGLLSEGLPEARPSGPGQETALLASLK